MPIVNIRLSVSNVTPLTYHGISTPSAAAKSSLLMFLPAVLPRRCNPGGDQSAAMLAAVKNKPCGWPLFEQPFLTAPARGGATVCIGRGGGMAPAKQRNAAYSLTPLPTRFLKEAVKVYLYWNDRIQPAGNQQGDYGLVALTEKKGKLVPLTEKK